jgi:hypothetical protein
MKASQRRAMFARMGKRPDRDKYYPIRSANSLPKLKSWIRRYANVKFPTQKIIVVDELGLALRGEKDKNRIKLAKMRVKAGYDSKYMAYGSYD